MKHSKSVLCSLLLTACSVNALPGFDDAGEKTDAWVSPNLTDASTSDNASSPEASSKDVQTDLDVSFPFDAPRMFADASVEAGD